MMYHDFGSANKRIQYRTSLRVTLARLWPGHVTKSRKYCMTFSLAAWPPLTANQLAQCAADLRASVVTKILLQSNNST